MDGLRAIRVLAISGSLRRASSNTALVCAATQVAPPGTNVSVYEGLGGLPAFNPDVDVEAAPSTVAEFRAALQAADAVLFSSPEYAHGVPGALKNALDWVVASGELIDKPVALLNATTRATRAWASLMDTLTVMSARIIREASITVPLDGLRLDSAGIVSTPELADLLQSALRTLSSSSRLVPEYSIRPARSHDLAQIPQIELTAARLLAGHAPESVLCETTDQEELERALAVGQLWVAVSDDVPVGFAQVVVLDARTAHLREIDVIPAHGRRGIGTRLVEEVCRWASAAGYDAVSLTTFRDVPWNMPFYSRLGFRVIPPAELSAPLRAVVQEETRRGLDASRRVVMVRACGPAVNVADDAPTQDLEFLETQINEYNFAATGIHDARALVILLRDPQGHVCAGLSGHTWGGVGEVRFLWVDESIRRTGVGGRLLRAAEDEARARGCTKVVLSTHSFQAPDFYVKQGYVIAGQYSDYPRGHSSIFLEKALR
jgi:NAD(P)H-dependent FMN reductase/GNAT superfamily N-acetyltransferase